MELTPWNIILADKLIVAQLLNNYPESSLPCLEEPKTELYAEAEKFSPISNSVSLDSFE
jgi:hypothetical protein